MKINFLGTSHGYAEKNRYTSATLIEQSGNYYLLDAGAPVEYLMVNSDKSYEKIRGIFITHMHNDHVGSLSFVIEPMLRYRYNDKAKCFFPCEAGKESFINWLRALWVDEDVLRNTVKMFVTTEGMVFCDDCIRVSARKTQHLGPDGDAFAYIFEADGKKVLFTGDMSQGFSEYSELVKKEHFDLVVCEGAHAPLSTVAEKLKNTITDRMIFNHCYFESIQGHEEILKTFPFPAEIAYDGMSVEI